MNISFTEKQLEYFKDFENAIKRLFGETTYVGTSHIVVKIEFDKNLYTMLRPNREELGLKNGEIVLDYELVLVNDKSCGGNTLKLVKKNK